MRMVPSIVKQRLKQDLPVLLFCATPTPEPRFVEMAAVAGYQALWIDHEHQTYSDPQIAQMCLACRAGGIDAMVRLRKRDRGSYFRPLEMGAHGVMLPHCNSHDEAAACVAELKFPPVGNRSADGIEPPAQFGWLPFHEYAQQANEETFVVVQIEEPEAVDSVEEIAAVPGVDVLFVGPGDLGLRYPEAALVEQAVERVAAAAREHGKHWGIPVSSAETAARRLAQGARLLSRGSVWQFVFEGFERIREELPDLLSG